MKILEKGNNMQKRGKYIQQKLKTCKRLCATPKKRFKQICMDGINTFLHLSTTQSLCAPLSYDYNIHTVAALTWSRSSSDNISLLCQGRLQELKYIANRGFSKINKSYQFCRFSYLYWTNSVLQKLFLSNIMQCICIIWAAMFYFDISKNTY